MKQTNNYKLNQWDKTDRIMMEDFNGDNLKVDEALAGQKDEIAALTAAMALAGNCRVWTKSYTGKGNLTPVSCTFPEMPLVFLVFGGEGIGLFWEKCPTCASLFSTVHNLTVSWTGTTAKWSHSNAEELMFNQASTIYQVLALLPPKA